MKRCQVGISVRDGGKYFPKREKQHWRDVNKSDRLCLEDPHNPERDVGAPSFRWDAIRFGFVIYIYSTVLQMGGNQARICVCCLFCIFNV